jgi:hypothetical protein
LAEMQYQLSELELEEFSQVLLKVYTG